MIEKITLPKLRWRAVIITIKYTSSIKFQILNFLIPLIYNYFIRFNTQTVKFLTLFMSSSSSIFISMLIGIPGKFSNTSRSKGICLSSLPSVVCSETGE